MDATRFDALARSFAMSSGSRRRAIQSMAVSAGLILSIPGVRVGRAQRGQENNGKNRRGKGRSAQANLDDSAVLRDGDHRDGPPAKPTLGPEQAATARSSRSVSAERYFAGVVADAKDWNLADWVEEGDRIATKYEGGSWSIDPRFFGYVGPGGYSSSIDTSIHPGCKIIQSFPYGTLLANIGDSNTYYRISGNGYFYADTSGYLWYRINDKHECSADNDGELFLTVTVGDEYRNPLGGKCKKSSNCGPGLYCKKGNTKKKKNKTGKCAINQGGRNRLINDAICWAFLLYGLLGEFAQCVLEVTGQDDCTGLTYGECAAYICDTRPEHCQIQVT